MTEASMPREAEQMAASKRPKPPPLPPRAPLRPPAAKADGGSVVVRDSVFGPESPTPTNRTNPQLVTYTDVIRVFDLLGEFGLGAQLEFVELATTFAQLSAQDRKRVIDIANRLNLPTRAGR